VARLVGDLPIILMQDRLTCFHPGVSADSRSRYIPIRDTNSVTVL
jgi:hypothetical protein